ncbi:MFS-type transporter clz9-like [Schistocerca piceifrons]|uniref:MFS-type transporter clz9-like n=1 Tax=Schistocerca piceifrons TaxID=274613 RepID=UPI001F5F0518|nr:MFS-type transporter clz9-like [Schistocerca piceifrons]
MRLSNEHLRIFTVEEEETLAVDITTAGNIHYGLTSKTARIVAYEYATRNGKSVPQNWEREKMAGLEWLRAFMKRNRLSLRTPEQTTLVTMVAIISASGTAVPTFLVFPRVHFKDHMLHNALPGSGDGATASGWMNSELFLPVLQHFVKHERTTKEHPKLMILDNHESHTSIAGISYAKENAVILLALPPHTSHTLQPLDVGVLAPFKKFCNTECCDLMADRGRSITIYDVAGLVGRVFPLAFTSRNICSGFWACGIEPLNSGLFN